MRSFFDVIVVQLLLGTSICKHEERGGRWWSGKSAQGTGVGDNRRGKSKWTRQANGRVLVAIYGKKTDRSDRVSSSCCLLDGFFLFCCFFLGRRGETPVRRLSRWGQKKRKKRKKSLCRNKITIRLCPINWISAAWLVQGPSHTPITTHGRWVLSHQCPPAVALFARNHRHWSVLEGHKHRRWATKFRHCVCRKTAR